MQLACRVRFQLQSCPPSLLNASLVPKDTSSLGARLDINVKVEYPKPKRIVFLPSAVLVNFGFYWYLRIYIFLPFPPVIG